MQRLSAVGHAGDGPRSAATRLSRESWVNCRGDGPARQPLRQRQGRELHEDAEGRGGVPDGVDARAGEAAHHPVRGHHPLERLARVLAAAIGVMQQFSRLAPAPDRHRQRGGDELGRSSTCGRTAAS